MAITWLTPAEITPGSAAAWTDADVSATVPAGATGVILHIDTDGFGEAYADVGWRKNGSTDNRTSPCYGDQHFWCAIGVDSSRILELYVESTTLVNIWLVGYFTDDASFFTNATNKSLGSTGTWTDIDISSDTGGDTAIAVILEIIDSTYGHDYGLRMNGSSDARTADSDQHCGAIIGCDVGEIFEGYISNTDTDFYLVGYITKEATFNTNATDLSLGSTGSWIDLSALPVGATGGFFEITANTYTETWGLRKNGSAEAIIEGPGGEQHAWGAVEADASQLIEGYISSTNVDFFLIGYSEEAAGGVVVFRRRMEGY